VDSGELGRLKHIDFKRAMKLSMKGGHYIDLINWYMGARPRSVTAELASTSSVDTRGAFFYDPQGYVQIEYDSGQTACLDGLDKRSDLLEGMRLSFDQGVINVDVAERTTRLVGPHGERDLADESSSTTYDWIANTFEALVSPGGIFVPCSVVEAMDSLAVIVAAHRSHRLGGQPIALPLAPQARAEVLRLA
jgi:predicted dehydrogenase